VVDPRAKHPYDEVRVDEDSPVRRSTAVRLLLWDFARGTLAYDLALLAVVLIVLLVPGGFWGDPLWRR
jgi:hypothetical protein